MIAAASATESIADSAAENQATFRAVMEAMARPGEIKTLCGVDAPPLLMAGTAAIIRSLADYETSVWLDATLGGEPEVAAWIRFQTGAPVVTDPQQAAFALVGNGQELPDFAEFSSGSADYPDHSVTLIVQIARFSGSAFCLAGPGIQAEGPLAAEPLPDDFVERCARNRALFPRGIDLLLVADRRVVALPRTACVTRRD